MKKLAALLVSAILTVGLLPAASAAGEPNPWKDSSIHIMEIESFESGYPSGDVNQWPGFWSYNQEIGYAPTSGLIKNGQLVINNGGTESFFFKRASGAISSSLLSQAEGVGFYVKNNTKSPVRLAFYGAGDKDKKDNGEAMFFFQKSAATFIDMQGNASTLSGKDSLVSLDAGKEGYVLFSFSDFVDGWHDNKKLDAPSGTSKELGEIIAGVRGEKLANVADYGRKGRGLREKDHIGYHSVRAGDISSTHTLIFGMEGERIEITHRSYDFGTFAKGALDGILFLQGKKPGVYAYREVLGL